jgi:hypothetical protein
MIFILTGCQKQPKASYVADKTSYVAGETMYLTNTSIDADHYLWTLPDGQTLTSTDAQFILSPTRADGTISVELEAFSKNGSKYDIASQTFNVIAAKGNAIFWALIVITTCIAAAVAGAFIDKATVICNKEESDVDALQLVEKVYDKKGLIPIIEKSKQGDNIWEITEVREKNPKIEWEDEVEEKNRSIMNSRGEEVINVPYTVSDMSSGLDPYFTPRDRVRLGKNDYTEWTPGLERMFAPTRAVKSWY